MGGDDGVEPSGVEQRDARRAIAKEFENQLRWRVLVHAAYALSLFYVGFAAISLILTVVFRGFIAVRIDGSSWFGILLVLGFPPLHLLKKKVDRRYEDARRRLLE